jgi:hypothetical protein
MLPTAINLAPHPFYSRGKGGDSISAHKNPHPRIATRLRRCEFIPTSPSVPASAGGPLFPGFFYPSPYQGPSVRSILCD